MSTMKNRYWKFFHYDIKWGRTSYAVPYLTEGATDVWSVSTALLTPDMTGTGNC